MCHCLSNKYSMDPTFAVYAYPLSVRPHMYICIVGCRNVGMPIAMASLARVHVYIGIFTYSTRRSYKVGSSPHCCVSYHAYSNCMHATSTPPRTIPYAKTRTALPPPSDSVPCPAESAQWPSTNASATARSPCASSTAAA